MKKCPYCAEEIQDDALKCRFCGEYLDKRLRTQVTHRSAFEGCLIGCIVLIIILIVGFITSMYLGVLGIKYVATKMNYGPGDYFYQQRGAMEGMLGNLMDAIRAFIEHIKNFFQMGVKTI